jgi:hypothetical protein
MHVRLIKLKLIEIYVCIVLMPTVNGDMIITYT